MPGATTTSPSGLSRSLATLAMNFEEPMPTEAVSPPVTSWTAARSSSATAVTVATSRSGRSAAGQVDERLVERQRLHQRGELAQRSITRSLVSR